MDASAARVTQSIGTMASSWVLNMSLVIQNAKGKMQTQPLRLSARDTLLRTESLDGLHFDFCLLTFRSCTRNGCTDLHLRSTTCCTGGSIGFRKSVGNDAHHNRHRAQRQHARPLTRLEIRQRRVLLRW